MKKIAKKDEGRIVEAYGDEWVAPVANAVIEEVANCYKAACKFESLYPEEARMLKEDCMEFFRGDWYDALTDLPRDRVISGLEARDWSDFAATRKEFEGMLESFGVKKRIAVTDYYKSAVEPVMDAILDDLRSGMKVCVLKQVYGITSLRWSQCREFVTGFKDATDAARAEGAKALRSRGEGKSRTEKFLIASLPYIRSRLAAGDTRTAIAKSLRVSFYRLKTFLDGPAKEARAPSEETAGGPADVEDERAERAKMDASRRDGRERPFESLGARTDVLPEGVAAQRARSEEKESEGEDERH